MLVRVHHLILSEEQGLKLSDFLLATYLPSTDIHPVLESNTLATFNEPSEPFCTFVPHLVHIPELYNQLVNNVCNWWNELLNSYGGNSSKSVQLKSGHGLFDMAVIIFIALATVLIDFLKDFTTVKEDAFKYFVILCRREIERKNLSPTSAISATLVSLNPKTIVASVVQFSFWITINCFILLPIMWNRECLAIAKYFIDPSEY